MADAVLPGSGGMLKQLCNLIGVGGYNINSNTVLASPVPSMHSTLDKGLRITHHEFVCDISSAVAFTNLQFSVNPGISQTFPWLSQISRAFQKYEVNGLVFFLKSNSATALNSTNTALGSVIGAMQYNVYDAAPANKTAMLALAGSSENKPSDSNIYPLECASDMVMYRTKLIRSSAVSDDLQKYDAATFNLAAVGSQAAAVIGSLYVSYDITLKAPVLDDYQASSEFSITAGDNTHPLGTAVVARVNTLGLVVDSTAKTITFPAGTIGYYEIEWVALTASAAASTPAITVAAPGALVNVFHNNTLSTLNGPAAAETATAVWRGTAISIASSVTPCVVTFGNPNTGAVTWSDVYVTRLPRVV